MKRLRESFPSLTSFVRPGELGDIGPGGGGDLDADDVIDVLSSDDPECSGDEILPIEPEAVPNVDAVIMQQWYPEDLQVESPMERTKGQLKDRIARLIRSEGITVSSGTMQAIDELLSKVSEEHRKAKEEEEPFDSYSNDFKGRSGE